MKDKDKLNNNLIRQLTNTRQEPVALRRQLTTHRKKQSEHSETEERVSKLCEAAFEGIIFMEDGVVLVTNEQFAEMVGCHASELIGMKVPDFFASESRDLVRQHIISGHEGRYEVQALRKDGSVFPAEVRGKQILYGGRNVRVKVIRDLSDQKQQEREWRNVLSMFAHDMKNPLVAATGFLSRVLSGKTGALTETLDRHLNIVKDELIKLEKLIRSFLEYSRLGANEYAPVMELLDVFGLISESTERARMEGEKKGLAISCEFEDFPHHIRADRGMIQRVITNLLENAIKHTNAGGSVVVKASRREENLVVHIVDTGEGIPEHHLPFIFDAFYKATPNTEGSGLGLAIVQSLLKAHGGHIWVESTPGKGSIFSFSLPPDGIA
jgi:PAS domain S-box-containing protein